LESYLTAEGWIEDWKQTKYDFKEFFSKGRRPIINGIDDPSKFEIALHQELEKDKGIIAKIAEVYFRPKSFERSGRLYEMLGVKLFRKVLMGTFGNLLKGRRAGAHYNSNYFIGSDRSIYSLKRFEDWTRFNETVHQPFNLLSFYLISEEVANGKY